MENNIFDPREQHESLSARTVVALERISEAFRVLLWNHAKVSGLSPTQIQLLQFVAHHPQESCNNADLAAEFNLTKPTISDAVRVLVQKGLLQKVQSETDKRAYSIVLTPEGEAIAAQTGDFARPIAEVLHELEPEEQQKLYATLGKVVFQLHQREILDVQRTCLGCKYRQDNWGGHLCQLLEAELEAHEIRMDCPEFEPVG